MNAVARFIAACIVCGLTLIVGFFGFFLLPIYAVGRARAWWRRRFRSGRLTRTP